MSGGNIPEQISEYLRGLIDSAIEDLKSALKEKLEHFIANLLAKQAMVTPLLEDSMVLPGSVILDYACGPGLFSIPAAKIVGDSGHVYAADVNPLAMNDVRASAEREGLDNVTTILTSCDTGLDADSVDVVLLFDCFYIFSDPVPILIEMHRVLEEDGFLSLEVEHEELNDAVVTLEKTGLFVKYSEDLLHKQALFQKT